MNPDARERLVASFSQYLASSSAGVARMVITDGYQAIDNVFSAVLIERDITPSRNHQRKLASFIDEFQPHLQEANMTRDWLIRSEDVEALLAKPSRPCPSSAWGSVLTLAWPTSLTLRLPTCPVTKK